MPSAIRSGTTPPAPKLPTPAKPEAAQPASQAVAKPAVKSEQTAAGIQNPANTAQGRNGALAAIRGEDTFGPAAKPLESAAKALGSAGTASAPDVQTLGPTANEAPSTGGPTTTEVSSPPSDPNQVPGWWNGLTPEQQSQQIDTNAQQLGSLDGLPASARDQANRELIQQDLDRLQAEAEAAKAERLEQAANSGYADELAKQPAETFLSDEKLHELQNVRAVQEQLERVEGQTDPVTGEPLTAQLLVYDPAFAGGEGRAAIAVGNVDTADDVSVSVPGLDSDVRSYMDNLTGNALNLYNESRQAGGNVATVAWLGYDAPTLANVASENAAENGARLLAQDVDAIRASRGDNQPHLTVIAHSYGSTTASIAADKEGLAADDLVLIGSPGAGSADNVSDYNNVDGDHVWVGSASRDPVTYFNDTPTLGTWDPLGLDPSLDDFGANRFQAESVNREDGGFGNFNNHSRYYDENSESLFNLASVVTGNYGRVRSAEQREQSGLDVDDPEFDRDPREVGY